jgi:hypothetical protein
MIYGRFEVTREVGGSPGNLEYEATDILSDAIVSLLQWTPETSAFGRVKDQLDGFRDRLPGIEAFSQDTSLYLAGSQDAVKAALIELRSVGLFTARWPNFGGLGSAAPGATLVAPVKAPAAPGSAPPGPGVPGAGTNNPAPTRIRIPEPKPTGTRGWAIAAWVAVIVVVIGGGGWMVQQAVTQHQQDQERLRLAVAERQRVAQQAAEEKQAVEARLAQEQAQRKREADEAAAAQKAADARLALEQAQHQHELEQAAEAKKAAEARLALEQAQHQHELELANQERERLRNGAAALSSRYYRIKLDNQCPDGTIRVALHFQDLDEKLVTRGWWQLAPNQEVVDIAYSKKPTYYFYAEGAGRTWPIQTSSQPQANLLAIDVVGNNFIHFVTDLIQGSNKRSVRALKVVSASYSALPIQFLCPK